MLLSDFLAAAVPILPFVFFPILQARIVSGAVTVARSSESELDVRKSQKATRFETVTAALAGVAISVLIDVCSLNKTMSLS